MFYSARLYISHPTKQRELHSKYKYYYTYLSSKFNSYSHSVSNPTLITALNPSFAKCNFSILSTHFCQTDIDL